jgi:(p)ppGpp synthase/HD superfamily hydrolase
MNLEVNEGIFEIRIDLYVHDTNDLEKLIDKVKKIKGVEFIKRTEKN